MSNTDLRSKAQNQCKFSVFESIMTAWSGGVYDPVGKRLLVWGGGLGNYRGNEIYAFSVEANSWSQISEPYCSATGDCQEPFANSTPMTRHSYNQLGFIAHANRLFVHGGASNCQGTANMSNTWTFDMATRKWTNMNPSGPKPDGLYESNCSYDPVTKKIYYQNGWQGFFSYDFDKNAWTQHNSIDSDGETYGLTSTIDTKRKLFVEMGRGNIITYDLSSPGLKRTVVTTSGSVPDIGMKCPALDYDAVADRIVYWNGGGSVYGLNLDTKVWTQHTSTGAPAKTQNGVYGRWRYIPEGNAFIAVTSVDANVYFYKYSAGAGVVGVPKHTKPGAPTLNMLPGGSGRSMRLNLNGLGSTLPVLKIFDAGGKSVASLKGRRSTPESADYEWSSDAGTGPYLVQFGMGGQTKSTIVPIQAN